MVEASYSGLKRLFHHSINCPLRAKFLTCSFFSNRRLVVYESRHSYHRAIAHLASLNSFRLLLREFNHVRSG